VAAAVQSVEENSSVPFDEDASQQITSQGQIFFYSPTDVKVNCLKNNFKI
jgi:hypothetical protein